MRREVQLALAALAALWIAYDARGQGGENLGTFRHAAAPVAEPAAPTEAPADQWAPIPTKFHSLTNVAPGLPYFNNGPVLARVLVGSGMREATAQPQLPAGSQERSEPKSAAPDPPKPQIALTEVEPHSSGTLKVVSFPSGQEQAELQGPSVGILHEEDETSLGRLTAGGGFYYIRTFFQTNPAFSTTLSPDATLTTGSQTDFHWDYQFAPRIWLGYVGNCGLGIRSRYWQFDQSTAQSLVNADTSGVTNITTAAPLGLSFTSPGLVMFKNGVDHLLFDSNLKLNVVDLEATQEFRLGRWLLEFSGGARYSHISQNYDAIRTDPPKGNGSGQLPGCLPSGSQPNKCAALNPPPPSPGTGGMSGGSGGMAAGTIPILVIQDEDFLQSGHSFNGVGPMAALEAHRCLGSTRFALYGSARGAVLFGHRSQAASLSSHLVGEYIVAGSPNIPFSGAFLETQKSAGNQVLPIAELEFGVEWARNWGRFQLFSQTALISQVWFDAGNASSTDGNLGFFGLSVVAGVVF